MITRPHVALLCVFVLATVSVVAYFCFYDGQTDTLRKYNDHLYCLAWVTKCSVACIHPPDGWSLFLMMVSVSTSICPSIRTSVRCLLINKLMIDYVAGAWRVTVNSPDLLFHDIYRSPFTDLNWLTIAKNETNFLPYHALRIDHKLQMVILAIRGTRRFKEFYINVMADMVPFMDGIAHKVLFPPK